MIRHIYLITLKDRMMMDEVADKLMSMKDEIPCIAGIEIGMDFKGDSNSADMAMICTFNDRDDFRAFGSDRYHAGIREYMKEVSTGVKIDYEV